MKCRLAFLFKGSNDSVIRLVSEERVETRYRRDLLTFYSRSMREMILSRSKTVSGAAPTDLVIFMPDCSVGTLVRLRNLLETGSHPGFSSEEEVRQLLDAADTLGVKLDQLQVGGMTFSEVLKVESLPVITSTVSIKQEMVDRRLARGGRAAGQKDRRDEGAGRAAGHQDRYEKDGGLAAGQQNRHEKGGGQPSTLHAADARTEEQTIPTVQTPSPTSPRTSPGTSPGTSPPAAGTALALTNTRREPENSPEQVDVTLELDSQPARSRRKSGTVSVCNYSRVCELCQFYAKSDYQLEDHMCGHFMEDIQALAEDFITSDLTCGKCGDQFKLKKRLVAHLGRKHGLINEVLRKKHLKVLPSSVNENYSAAKQKRLKEIKIEKIENADDDIRRKLEMDLE